MNRSTLHDVRFNTRTAIALNLCRDDPRVADYVNEAQRLTLEHGHWFGTVCRWSICAYSGCITLPPQLAAIEKAAVCGQPILVKDYWQPFLTNGWGTGSGWGWGGEPADGAFINATRNWSNCGIGDGANLIGTFPTFDDIRGVNKKLNATCDLASDVGKKVLCLGYDENLNWIRTDQDGVISDGEILLMSQSAGTDSVNLFSSMTDIQFVDERDGQCWLFEKNVDDSVRRLIGNYFYWERHPAYPRYRVGGIGACGPAVNDSSGCRKVLIEVLAKLEFIPVKKDSDYLIVQNLTAIKDACLAVKYAEPPADMAKSEIFLQRALRALNNELETHLGSARHIGINNAGTGQFAAEPVPAFM